MKKSQLREIIREEIKKIHEEKNVIKPGKNAEVKQYDRILDKKTGDILYIYDIDWDDKLVGIEDKYGNTYETDWSDFGLYAKGKKLYLK